MSLSRLLPRLRPYRGQIPLSFPFSSIIRSTSTCQKHTPVVNTSLLPLNCFESICQQTLEDIIERRRAHLLTRGGTEAQVIVSEGVKFSSDLTERCDLRFDGKHLTKIPNPSLFLVNLARVARWALGHPVLLVVENAELLNSTRDGRQFLLDLYLKVAPVATVVVDQVPVFDRCYHGYRPDIIVTFVRVVDTVSTVHPVKLEIGEQTYHSSDFAKRER